METDSHVLTPTPPALLTVVAFKIIVAATLPPQPILSSIEVFMLGERLGLPNEHWSVS